MISVRVNGLEDFSGDISRIIKGYSGASRNFLRKESTKAKKVALRIEKAEKWKYYKKKPTGNLRKGISTVRPYAYYWMENGKAPDSVKVVAKKPAYHAHLIEYGHKKVLWGRRTADIVRGFYLFDKAEKDFKPTFETDCERFVNELIARVM